MIDHLDLFSGGLKSLRCIALVTYLKTLLLRSPLNVFKHLRARYLRVGAGVPFYLQRRQPLARGTGMVSDDRHGVLSAQHLMDTTHSESRCRI
ncbi:hypothetical protein D3C71_2027680 [compost metagenome]